MSDQINPQQQLIAQIVAKCWADDAFKQRLLTDTAATLKAEGLEIPEGTRVNVVENTAEDFTFILPPPPTELSDAELAGVAGGKGGHCGITCEKDAKSICGLTSTVLETAGEVAPLLL